MMGTALILTNGKLAESDAKTAHGLIRGSGRFNILGVIDSENAGRDAGEVLDGVKRNIPVFPSIADFMDKTGAKPDYCIVGVALSGGRLPSDWNQVLLEAIESGISIVNSMHQLLSETPELKAAALQSGVDIIDMRKPKPVDELHFWSGAIYDVKAPRIAVLGMDCAIGKRTTCRFILEACLENGIKTEMIYTGQTGWMQGGKYGFIFDSTLNDFVSGELEWAIVECDRETAPDLILIEGQSGLRNPSGPCGSEFILSGDVKGVILQHAPFRTFFDDLEHIGCVLHDVEKEIELIRLYGAEVLAVTLNGEGGTNEELIEYQKNMEDKLGIPVIRPLEEGMKPIIPLIRHYIDMHERLNPVTELRRSNQA